MPENLHELVSDLIVDTKGSPTGFLSWTADSSLMAFSPELVICATILALLLLRLCLDGKVVQVLSFLVALVGSGLAFYLAVPWEQIAGAAVDYASPTAVTRMEIFTGMLVHDTFSVYIRAVLFAFVVLFLIFTQLSGIPNREDNTDIYTLMLGATLGMCLMASANHLLMVFVAVEMASVPSYALAGLMKGRRQASEAALKYAIYGAGTAGVMLYGISLVAGLLNTAHLPTLAVRLAERMAEGPVASETMVLSLGALMIMVGLAFKLSAVPFHFWCPDVFEGATAEVNAFLSIASKAAALALLVRVAIGFGVVPTESVDSVEVAAATADSGPTYYKPGVRTELMSLAAGESQNADEEAEASTTDSDAEPSTDTENPPAAPATPANEAPAEDESDQASLKEVTSAGLLAVDEGSEKLEVPTDHQSALADVRSFIAKMITLFAILTCTFGNLAAYGQTNIKRLMAYSTIAHAGYMMMPIPVVLMVVGHDVGIAQGAVAALCIYIGIYVFLNLGAFSVIAFLRNSLHSEEIADYAGLIRRHPVMVVSFALIMFSLIGLPPLAGFIGKFAIFASIAEGWRSASAEGMSATFLLVLLLAGGVNTAISLFYYLRVVKTMTLDPEPEARETFGSPSFLQGAFVFVLAATTVIFFVEWNWLSNVSHMAAQHLFPLS